MRIGKKGFIFILILILMVSSVFAQESDYARYYMIGYMEGYNSPRRDTNRYTVNQYAVRATNIYFGDTTPENRDNKSAFKNGFIDGLRDKESKSPNKYTSSG